MEKSAFVQPGRPAAAKVKHLSPSLIALEKQIDQFMFEMSCKMESEFQIQRKGDMINELMPTEPVISRMQQEEIPSEQAQLKNEQNYEDSESDEVDCPSIGLSGPK